MGNQQSVSLDHQAVLADDRNLSDTTTPLPPGGYRSTPDLRVEIRERVFGNGALNGAVPRDDLLNTPVTRQHQPSSPSTLARLLNLQDTHPANVSKLAAILQEFKNTASQEELDLLRKALFPENSSDATPQSVGGDFHYRGTVVRRKSLHAALPGAATRTNKAQKVRKQPTTRRVASPERTESRRPTTWAMEQLTLASPLSTLADMGVSTGGPVPSNRPTTPNDIECANLGALKALRVMNASPQPSIVSSIMTSARLRQQPAIIDDYFTCSEGFRSDNDDGTSSGNVLTDDSQSTVSTAESPTTPVTGARFHTDRLSKKPQRKLAISPIGSRKVQHHQFDHELAHDNGSEPFAMYSQEALSNPFGHSGDEVEPEATVGHAPVEITGESLEVREVFPDIESIYSDHAQTLSPNASTKRSNSRKLALDSLNGTAEVVHSPTKTDQFAHDHHTGSVDYTKKHISTTALSHDARNADGTIYTGPPTGYLAYSPALELKLETSTPARYYASQKEQARTPTSATASQCAHTVRDHVSSKTPTAHDNPLKCDTSRVKSSPAAYSKNISVIASQGKIAADQLDLNSPGSNSSLPSSPEKSKKRNKLQKKRFSKEDVCKTITVQSNDHPPLDNVPAVPRHVATSHQNRMMTFQELDHTFDSTSQVDVRPESPERFLSPAEIRFPSPAHADDDSPSSARGRNSRRSSIGPGTSPSRLLLSLSRRASKDRKVSDPHDIVDGDIFGVKDFGAVPDLVDASPYDAVSRMSKKPRPKTVDPTRFYQRDSRTGRARPTVGMDDKTASELAKWRSRDLLTNGRDIFAPPQAGPQAEPVRQEAPQRPVLKTLLTEPRAPALPTKSAIRVKDRPQSSSGLVSQRSSEGFSRLVLPQQQTPQSLAATGKDPPHLQDEVQHAWKSQADFWRHRKAEQRLAPATKAGSIERNQQLFENSIVSEVPSNAHELSSTPRENESLPGKTNANKPSPFISTPKFGVPRIGARSPSPSIRERAAFFEKAEARAESPRGSPSPTRDQARQKTAASLLSTYEINSPGQDDEVPGTASMKLQEVMIEGARDDVQSRAMADVRVHGDGGDVDSLTGDFLGLRAALRNVT